ncbi:olfactory receptor 14J1-like [Empidonax traillii]|uniref:olfactory receptor 14J1-like n=1 Tax=Empidonax traillii TaxID=164674 RepID=UPI000FFD80CE|nr:olfactory receptor 14J1-like [Empidonax traillii]
MPNSSSMAQFLLLAFSDRQELQLLPFWLFLGNSLAALLGNGLILSAVACDQHLHTPRDFFLLHLFLTDLGCICTTVPKAMHNSLWDTTNISYTECAAQAFFFLFFISAEFSLLTIMCYNRYIAICKPLHYGTLLGSRACAQMVAAAWTSGFVTALLHTANTFSLPLCQGNALGQFFCEIPNILKLSCSHSGYLREIGLLKVSGYLVFNYFVFMVFSYVQIFRAVVRIPSEQGWHKAFSTCLPHRAVVSLFNITSFIAYLKPPSISSPSLDLVLSVLYLVILPALNPLIYSLRNQELKDALRKLITGYFSEAINSPSFACYGPPPGTVPCANCTARVCHGRTRGTPAGTARCAVRRQHTGALTTARWRAGGGGQVAPAAAGAVHRKDPVHIQSRRRARTLETCCGYGYDLARDLHPLTRIFTDQRELIGRCQNCDAFQGAGLSLGANPFQGARSFTKKKELSLGLPPASPGSVASPHWAPHGARLCHSRFQDLNPTPFRSAEDNGGHRPPFRNGARLSLRTD